MKTNEAGLTLIRTFEGVRHEAYKDSVGIWTIGIGHTRGVHEGDKATDEDVDRFLREDLQEAETGVLGLVHKPLNENQFAALVCLVFNIGQGAFAKSTLCRLLNAGEFDNAPFEFPKWNKAKKNGQWIELPGLTRRRHAEEQLFRTPA